MAPQRLGQHFLSDESTLRRIAAWACPETEPAVIEIGAGKGALTRFLLERADRLIAIEVDANLVRQLSVQFGERPNLEIVHGDVLAVDFSQWGQAVVAGNLPYYITSPILKKVLSLGSLLRRAVFLVQREVAERVAAAPGSRDYGYLSVLVQLSAKVVECMRVPPGAFRPPPKVDSTVLVLEPHSPLEAWGVTDQESFLEFAGICFRQKRKTLRNNLLAVYPREHVDQVPSAGMRAEQLSLRELAEIWSLLQHTEF